MGGGGGRGERLVWRRVFGGGGTGGERVVREERMGGQDEAGGRGGGGAGGGGVGGGGRGALVAYTYRSYRVGLKKENIYILYSIQLLLCVATITFKITPPYSVQLRRKL